MCHQAVEIVFIFKTYITNNSSQAILKTKCQHISNVDVFFVFLSVAPPSASLPVMNSVEFQHLSCHLPMSCNYRS